MSPPAKHDGALAAVELYHQQAEQGHARHGQKIDRLHDEIDEIKRSVALLSDKIIALQNAPAVISKLHLTTPQVGGLLMVAAGLIVAVMRISGGMEAQFRLQDERNTTLTAMVQAVTKAQSLSDERRVRDFEQLRKMIEDQKGVGTKR